MKSFNALLATILVVTMVGSLSAASFSDVPRTHWAYSAIERAVDAGILQGYDGKYHGQRLLNRYQIAVITSKILDAVTKRGGDVPAGMGADLDKLMEEFGSELALLNSRLTAVEEKVAAVTGTAGELKLSGCQVVCDDQCTVKCGDEAISANAGNMATVYSRQGKSLKIGGIVKTWYRDVDSANASEFDLRNARLLLLGQVSRDIKFALQTEQAHDNVATTLDLDAGGTATVSDSPSLLDCKLMINLDQANPWKTWLQFGRFIPNIQRYQPVLINTMDFIHYPVLTQATAVFRQSGLEVRHKRDNMMFTFGILNGSDRNDNLWTGDISTRGGANDAKDYFVRMDVTPKGSKLSGALYHWAGSYGPDELDRDQTGFFIEYKCNPWRALVEYITCSNGNGAGLDDTDMDGFYGQIIYHRPGSRLEYLVRYDDFDPNDAVDGDGTEWFTLGVNWLLEGRDCVFGLNYIDKEVVDVDDTEIVGQFTFIF